VLVLNVYRMRTAFRTAPQANTLPASILIRIIIFTIYAIVAIMYVCLHSLFESIKADVQLSRASFALASDFANSTSNIFLASVPVSSFLIFGMQEDIIGAWLWWRRPRRASVFGNDHHSALKLVPSGTGATTPTTLVSPVSYRV
jgi:hypothetical protein